MSLSPTLPSTEGLLARRERTSASGALTYIDDVDVEFRDEQFFQGHLGKLIFRFLRRGVTSNGSRTRIIGRLQDAPPCPLSQTDRSYGLCTVPCKPRAPAGVKASVESLTLIVRANPVRMAGVCNSPAHKRWIMLDRREFLAILSSTVAAMVSGEVLAAASDAATVELAKLSTLGKAYTFFNDAEVAFIEAAMSRLIPKDELGPGALEAEVGYFLDNQLSGPYGTGAKAYLQGPWGELSRFQGYQLALTPQQLYRVGIAATDRYCRATYGKTFATLDGAQQDEVLRGLQGIAGDVDLKDVPGAVFFSYLLRDTKDGFFADPIYGGNQDMVSWKLVGYPGVAAVYSDFMFRHNEPYNVQPVSIHGMQHTHAPGDQRGHAIHRPANPQDIRQTAAPPLGPGESRVARVETIDPLIVGNPIV